MRQDSRSNDVLMQATRTTGGEICAVPVNYVDPLGLCQALPGTSTCISTTVTSTLLGLPPAAGGSGSGRFGNAEVDADSQLEDSGPPDQGGGLSVLNPWTLNGFSQAFSMAMGALATSDCAKHFGLAGSRSMDPSTVLARASNATTTATNLFFDVTTDDRVGASTDWQGIVVTTTDAWAYTAKDGTKIESTRAKISINLNSWNNASSTWRAGTLIHELGHVFNMLLGAGGSDFVYDAMPSGAPNPVAEATNARILQDCIHD